MTSDRDEPAAEVVGKVLPQLRVAVAQLGVGPLEDETWSVVDTWAATMPLQAGTGQDFVVSVSSRLDRLALRAVGDVASFGPAASAWLEAVGARGSPWPDGADRIGGWVEVRGDGGVDGGWAAGGMALDRALAVGELSPSSVTAVRRWADETGADETEVVERSAAGPRSSTAVTIAFPGPVEDGLAAATGLAGALRVPAPPDDALGALAQSEEAVRVTCRLTAGGTSGFGVAVGGLAIGVVIDLWRMSGGDHQALAILQGALLADDPAYVEWSVAAGGTAVLCHYDLG